MIVDLTCPTAEIKVSLTENADSSAKGPFWSETLSIIQLLNPPQGIFKILDGFYLTADLL